jgi:hypothetical protein
MDSTTDSCHSCHQEGSLAETHSSTQQNDDDDASHIAKTMCTFFLPVSYCHASDSGTLQIMKFYSKIANKRRCLRRAKFDEWHILSSSIQNICFHHEETNSHKHYLKPWIHPAALLPTNNLQQKQNLHPTTKCNQQNTTTAAATTTTTRRRILHVHVEKTEGETIIAP